MSNEDPQPQPISETHPLVVYGRAKGWTRRQTAAHFSIDFADFRRIVTGWRGVSLDTSDAWERASGGRVRSIDVLRWHRENRRGADSEPTAAAAS